MTDPRLDCADKLEAAAYVVMLPDWHCKGWFARDSEKETCDEDLPRACSFCMLGAYYAAGGKHRDAGWQAITDLAGGPSWNDTPGRTSTEVASLMLDAADALRAEVES